MQLLFSNSGVCLDPACYKGNLEMVPFLLEAESKSSRTQLSRLLEKHECRGFPVVRS